MAKTVVIGVIGSDVHAVGNKIIERALSDEGYKVINIGVLSTQEEFVNAAIETSADAIMVGSLYGHGEIDCRGLKDKCIEANLENVKLLVGGNIVIGKQDNDQTIIKFKEMGYDEVFLPGEQIFDVMDRVKKCVG